MREPAGGATEPGKDFWLATPERAFFRKLLSLDPARGTVVVTDDSLAWSAGAGLVRPARHRKLVGTHMALFVTWCRKHAIWDEVL